MVEDQYAALLFHPDLHFPFGMAIGKVVEVTPDHITLQLSSSADPFTIIETSLCVSRDDVSVALVLEVDTPDDRKGWLQLVKDIEKRMT